MNKDILIFGKGFIGRKLQEAFDCNVTARRINTFEDAEEEVRKYNPKIVINCIGYTGKNNVDDCEMEKGRTLLANTFVPAILGDLAFRKNIKLVHISSGCVYHFDYENQKPITEEDSPDFFDLFYSRSKIYADKSLQTLFNAANILIVKIRIPLDYRPHPRNILTKLLNFKRIIDIPNSLTYIPDFIEMLKHLLKVDARGIYNAVNKNSLRYPELLEVYKKHVPEYRYEVIKPGELDLIRTNLIMSVEKLESTGFKVRDIHEVLEECVQKYLAHSS